MHTSLTIMKTSKTTRLQDHTNHKGLALCGHITVDVTARWWVPVNTHGTPAPQRRGAQNFTSDYKPPTRLKHLHKQFKNEDEGERKRNQQMWQGSAKAMLNEDDDSLVMWEKGEY